MRDTTNERADQPLRERKIRDRALILPLIGLILLTPPVATIFQFEAKFAGVPVTAVYLFAVWALLIAGAAALSGRLRDSTNQTPEAGGNPGGDKAGDPAT